MNTLRKYAVTGLMLSAIVGLAACNSQKSGPAETAGQGLEDAARTAGSAVGDAAEKTGQVIGDAADKTGQVIGDAADKTRQAISDTTITSKIKAGILAESGLSVTEIHVETTNGAVTLTGTVKSKADSDKAASIARSADGVKGVDNRLQVNANG